MRKILLPLLGLFVYSAKAQLNIDNATFFIGEGAIVTVQGNLTTNVAIQAGGAGATQGKIQMKGTGVQQINTNGFLIPRLEIDNTSNVTLVGDVRVSNRLEFTNGKIQLGNFNFILNNVTDIIGANGTRFLETNGTGTARRLLPAGHVTDQLIPVGIGSNYTPFSFTTTGTDPEVGDFVAVRSSGVPVPTPDRHPRTESYLNTFWQVTRNSLPAGTQVAATGTYVDGQITGPENDILGMFWNGTNWTRNGGNQNAASNIVGANVPLDGTMYGMNRFLLVNPKVFLQGAYNSGTGLMAETYRTAPSIIPLTDPYRSAQLSPFFTHVSNNTAETIDASVLANQANANHNIVDWVFVQLRTITNATTAPVVQTRAALLRRNGEIVDIDNFSPLYFKNLAVGDYAISVRHRNHLGIGSNPAVPIGLGLAATPFDFTTTAAGNVYGTAGTNYLFANAVRQMYAGDVNTSGVVNYISLGASDRAALLSTMANPGNAIIPARNITNSADYLTYGRGDLNFDKIVNYISLGVSDRSFLLSTILSGALISSKTQLLPNN